MSPAAVTRENENGNAKAMVCVGIITGAKGLRGELWVRSFTAEPESVGAYGPVFDEAGGRPLRLDVVDVDGVRGRVLARVGGVGDRTQAEALKGRSLYVPRAAFPEPDVDEFYHNDLIGAAVWLEGVGDGAQPLGRISHVHDYGAGPLLDIDRADGGTLLAPFTRAVVPVVDVAAGRVVIRPVPGLLEPADVAPEDLGEDDAVSAGGDSR
jgi:16S rRNA processing protein RimM